MSEDVIATRRAELAVIEPDVVLSPPEVNRLFILLHNELGSARMALREARYKELRDLKAYSDARAPLALDPACPEPSRSTGVTRDDRECWINAKIPDLYWAHQAAKVVRQAAEDYSRQLNKQVDCMQSINANVRQAYNTGGR